MGDAVMQPLGAGGRWQELQESSAPDPLPLRPQGGRRGQDGGVMGLDPLAGFHFSWANNPPPLVRVPPTPPSAAPAG